MRFFWIILLIITLHATAFAQDEKQTIPTIEGFFQEREKQTESRVSR